LLSSPILPPYSSINVAKIPHSTTSAEVTAGKLANKRRLSDIEQAEATPPKKVMTVRMLLMEKESG
jgi:hypothetical protein